MEFLRQSNDLARIQLKKLFSMLPNFAAQNSKINIFAGTSLISKCIVLSRCLTLNFPSNNQGGTPHCASFLMHFSSQCVLSNSLKQLISLRPAGRTCGSKKGKYPWPARNPKHRVPGWGGYLYVLCTSISDLSNYL